VALGYRSLWAGERVPGRVVEDWVVPNRAIERVHRPILAAHRRLRPGNLVRPMAVDVEQPAGAPREPAVATPQAVLRLALAAVICVVLAAGIGVFFVGTPQGQRMDDAAERGRVIQHPRAREESNRVLRTITESSLALLGGALMVVAALRGRWHLAVAVGVVILGANLTTEALKATVPRPDLINALYDATFNTWPSGHATVAASLAAALVMVVPARARPLAATIGAFYAGAIAVGVLAAGWHRPSDALAAFAIVGAWAFGVSAALVAWRGPGRPVHRASLPALAVGAVIVLGVAFAALAVTTTVDRAEGIELVKLGAAYLVASGALVTAAVALVSALVLVLRGISLDAHGADA
jgi:hypothetical protein